jgi:hypothetical protein
VHTEEDGFFSFSSVPDGDYPLDVKCPGYLSVTMLRHIGPGMGGQNFELVPASVYDPLETDTGWSVSAPGDNAVYGRWVWAEPHGTLSRAHVRYAVERFGAQRGAPPMCTAAIAAAPRRDRGDGAVPGVQPDHDRRRSGALLRHRQWRRPEQSRGSTEAARRG